MNDTKHAKDRASDIIGKFSRMIETTTHHLIESGEKVKEHLDKAFVKAQEELEEVFDYIGTEIVPTEELKDGDLVISPADVKLQPEHNKGSEYPDGVLHKKGVIFEYDELRDSPYVNVLLKPSIKQASRYGAVKELERLYRLTSKGTAMTVQNLNEDIKHKIEFYQNEK